MSIQVIGVGLGRTGTRTLKEALEMLDFGKCYHMQELIENPDDLKYWTEAEANGSTDWPKLFEGYQSTADYPGCLYYKDILKTYPEAKVILTVRDANKWYESAIKTIYNVHKLHGPKTDVKKGEPLQNVFDYNALSIWQGQFNNQFEDREFAISLFNQHIEEVKSYVPSHQLLIYEVSEGWEPLCNFLKVTPPSEAFPALNNRASFREKVETLHGIK